MDKVKEGCAAIVFCGDLNGGPHELFHQVLEEQGYVSAYRACHGQDPQVSSGCVGEGGVGVCVRKCESVCDQCVFGGMGHATLDRCMLGQQEASPGSWRQA